MRVSELVWVQLTEKGEEVLRDYERGCTSYSRRIKHGFHQFPMSVVMKVFGPHLSPDGLPLFVGNVIEFGEPPYPKDQ